MMHGLLNTLIGAASFFLVLGLVVFIHELGHYSVARFFKVSVAKFSIGFGRPIVKWKAKSGTQWAIGRIPLGGYVQFMGDAGAASNPDRERLAQIKADMESKYGKDAWKSCLHFKTALSTCTCRCCWAIGQFHTGHISVCRPRFFVRQQCAFGQNC